MIYIEHRPVLPISAFVDRFWYCRSPDLAYSRERVLPSGRIQILFNLFADELIKCCAQTGRQVGRLPSAVVAGPRTQYEVIASEDLRELVGIVFRPNGFAFLSRVDAGSLFQQFVPLEDVCRDSEGLRDRLCEILDPKQKLAAVEDWITALWSRVGSARRPDVGEALTLLQSHRVEQVAHVLGVSGRRLHQVFKAEVGMSPKQWACIARFQKAVRLLRGGKTPRWEQLALECGFYDQPQMCREFKAYAGIDPSTYVSGVGAWANHVPEG